MCKNCTIAIVEAKPLAFDWSRHYATDMRCYVHESSAGHALRNHGVAIALVLSIGCIAHGDVRPSPPKLHATIVNNAHYAREFVVGPAQSPSRQRFWLDAGNSHAVEFPFIGESSLAVAELRAGSQLWEGRAGQWSEAATAASQRIVVGHHGAMTVVCERD
jgi:hypothetical protein